MRNFIVNLFMFLILPIRMVYHGCILACKVLFNRPLSPSVSLMQFHDKSEIYVTIMANSITLTPGTIAVRANKNEVLVHIAGAP
jgi:multicomponent Na+:H+ antiporter subunit E